MEGMAVYAAFRQCAVAESITAATTDSPCNTGLRNISDGQVQYMFYAIFACCIRFCLDISVCFIVFVASPDKGLARADGHKLLVAYNLPVDDDGNDAIAAERRSIAGIISTATGDGFSTISGRESGEGHPFRPCVSGINRQLQDIERVYFRGTTTAEEGVHIGPFFTVVLAPPGIFRTLAYGCTFAMNRCLRRSFFYPHSKTIDAVATIGGGVPVLV